MDITPGTGLAILGAAAGSTKLVEKILGPTAEYIGEGLQNWTAKAVSHVGKIFTKAASRLGNRVDQPGAVPPKVLRNILQDGAFCDDELSAEYFGGILASSRSEIPRDDRGAALLSLVSRLTTYQIRAHYIFYYLFKSLLDGESLSPTLEADAHKMRIFVPITTFVQAMDFSDREDLNVLTTHIVFGLRKEGLIARRFLYGTKDSLRSFWKAADSSGILLEPSPLGVELFLWAYGAGDLPIQEYLNPELQFPPMEGITIAPGYRRIED